MYFESKGRELRQKAINLMYLIFLAFLFTYVPADFLDSIQHSGKSLDMLAKEADKENTNSTIYFLNLLKDDPELYESTKADFLAIEDFSQELEKFIEQIKINIISKDGVDSLGYFINGKKSEIIEHMLLETNLADSAIHSLGNYKKFILDYIGYEHEDALNEMLGTTSMIKKSDGNLIPTSKFYFSHTPLNVAVSNLNHLKGGIERVKIYTYRIIVKNLIDKNRSNLPLEILQNFDKADIDQLGNATTLRDFFEKINNSKNTIQNKPLEIKNSMLMVESLTDTIYPEGHPFKFHVYFDTAVSKKVTIQVNGPSDKRTFITNRPGPFIYLPISRGRYTVTFKDGLKSLSKSIRVIDVEPVIQNTKLSTIYAGIDNPLNIRTTEFGTQDQMVATITKGEIFRKGDKFYARVSEPGMVQVAIFAKMPYGIVKVAEQMFAVRSLNNPTAIVNTHSNGSTVSLISLKNMKALKVITDEYMVDESYYIQEFSVSLIYNDHTSITKPFNNAGSSFNPYLLELLSKAKSGDKLIFTNIIAKSNLGNKIELNPYSLNIK